MRAPLLVAALLSCACGGSPTSPTTTGTAKLTISFSPNPARVGTRPTLSIRETAGVGVTATRIVYRHYDANGAMTSQDTFTDQNAWFTCDNTGDATFAHLPGRGECTLLQSTRQTASQFEFDLFVTDDNKNDLKFTSPRAVTTP